MGAVASFPSKDSEALMLLAGVAGSGKSTLTAALLANGFAYCADDLVLLTDAPVRVRGVPVRLGLKAGSWKVVTEAWPELADLHAHLRADGKLIRYFLPSGSEPVDEPSIDYRASSLVFPRYGDGLTTSMQELPKGQALMMLTQAGYDFAEVINKDVVSTLVAWISDLPCYSLEYSELSSAVSEIRKFFGKASVR